MALRPFSSVDGYAVSENGNVVIDANANVVANTLLVNSTSNLGSVANVTILGGSANTAVAGAVTVVGGSITEIAITSGGDGYDIAPVVTISGAYVTAANVTAVLTSGVVTSITINDGGTGYDTPTASIAAPNPKYLKTDGSGVLSWSEVASSGGGGGGGGTPGGSNTQVQFNDSGSFGGEANFTYDKTTSTLSVNGNVNLDNQTPIKFNNGANYVSFQAPATIPASVAWTLPNVDGANGNVLATDGAGQLYWRATSSTLTIGTRSGSTTIDLQNGVLNIIGRDGNIPVPIY